MKEENSSINALVEMLSELIIKHTQNSTKGENESC